MSDIERLDTWVKIQNGLCSDCMASCCSMPVEVKLPDLVRMGIVDEFELQEPVKNIAKRLEKQRIIQHFNFKYEVFTLSRRANGDCMYLDQKTRLCTSTNSARTPAATTPSGAAPGLLRLHQEPQPRPPEQLMSDKPAPKDPLQGVTLEALLNELVAHYGWPQLGRL